MMRNYGIPLDLVQDDEYCTPESAKLFQTVIEVGYEIFKANLPLKKIRGCKNKYFEESLLLIERKLLKNIIKKKEIAPQNMNAAYEIEIFDDGGKVPDFE